LSFSQISIVNIKNDQIKYAKGKRACACKSNGSYSLSIHCSDWSITSEPRSLIGYNLTLASLWPCEVLDDSRQMALWRHVSWVKGPRCCSKVVCVCVCTV